MSSVFDIVGDENVNSWVLVYFADSDPGKEFEILARTRLSVPENVYLRPQRKVKVFYGKAKIEAYVVAESADYRYLQNNFKILTTDYTENSSFKKTKRQRELSSSEEQEVPMGNKRGKVDQNAEQEQYSTLNDLYRMQNAMKTTIDVLMDRVEMLTEKMFRAEKVEQADTSIKVDEKQPLRKRYSKSVQESDVEYVEEMVYIGENRTAIPKDVFESINWNSCSQATRKLLVAVFSKSILATHSLTGKPSPAFLNVKKELKEQLDPYKTADIIEIVSRRCKVSVSMVRNAITTKCADENKMLKKKRNSKGGNKYSPFD